MFSGLAVLVYAAALAVPVYLLHHFQSQAWYWHVLAVGASLALGLAPVPPEFQAPGFDLFLGSAFVVLLIWGAGGLIVYHPHQRHQKHA